YGTRPAAVLRFPQFAVLGEELSRAVGLPPLNVDGREEELKASDELARADLLRLDSTGHRLVPAAAHHQGADRAGEIRRLPAAVADPPPRPERPFRRQPTGRPIAPRPP